MRFRSAVELPKVCNSRPIQRRKDLQISIELTKGLQHHVWVKKSYNPTVIFALEFAKESSIGVPWRDLPHSLVQRHESTVLRLRHGCFSIYLRCMTLPLLIVHQSPPRQVSLGQLSPAASGFMWLQLPSQRLSDWHARLNPPN